MASSILKVVFALSKSPHLHRELSNRLGMSVSHCTISEIECVWAILHQIFQVFIVDSISAFIPLPNILHNDYWR